MIVSSKSTDEDLTVYLRHGHQAAFTEIYNRYWKKLLIIAYNHSKDKFAAEEVVQEVFLNLWHRKNDVVIGSLSAYLATAVKFSIFKQLQRRRRRLDILKLNNGAPASVLDEENIYARFLDEYVNGIVEQLPEKCRMVFKYSRQQGKTIPEISTAMDIAEKTAEGHLTKALKTIRFQLQKAGILLLILTAHFSLIEFSSC